MNWLVVSIVLTIVLTVVLNVVLRVVPGVGDRIDREFTRVAERRPNGSVFVPWQAMFAISVALTIAVNLVLWALR